ncbi:MAG: glycosyltransferase, partial [Bacteroidales bacterium]|nr:glycosyltransferase [Bacteroidales bacterium]
MKDKYMISFIIIGRNIENTIAKCIESVIRFIGNNNIIEYEIVYVDSESKDKTIEIAKKYPIKIFQIKGQVNAAIGRNVGAKNAKGDILFFIDGDMEILPDFYPIAFDTNTNKLKYPFSSGPLLHKHYNGKFEYLYLHNDE